MNNEALFKMLAVQKDIEKNSKVQTILRAIAALYIFVVFICGSANKTALNIGFGVAIPVIAALFVMDSGYAKKKHSLEVEIYLLELESLKSKKEDAENKGDGQQANILDSIEMPEDKEKLPIVYYCILLVLDVVIWIF